MAFSSPARCTRSLSRAGRSVPVVRRADSEPRGHAVPTRFDRAGPRPAAMGRQPCIVLGAGIRRSTASTWKKRAACRQSPVPALGRHPQSRQRRVPRLQSTGAFSYSRVSRVPDHRDPRVMVGVLATQPGRGLVDSSGRSGNQVDVRAGVDAHGADAAQAGAADLDHRPHSWSTVGSPFATGNVAFAREARPCTEIGHGFRQECRVLQPQHRRIARRCRRQDHRSVPVALYTESLRRRDRWPATLSGRRSYQRSWHPHLLPFLTSAMDQALHGAAPKERVSMKAGAIWPSRPEERQGAASRRRWNAPRPESRR